MIDQPGDNREANKSYAVAKSKIVCGEQSYQACNKPERDSFGHQEEKDTKSGSPSPSTMKFKEYGKGMTDYSC